MEVCNNLVIERIQCFGTSFFGRIDHLASLVIKFRPKNSVPKHYSFNNRKRCNILLIYIFSDGGNDVSIIDLLWRPPTAAEASL